MSTVTSSSSTAGAAGGVPTGTPVQSPPPGKPKPLIKLPSVTIRFAGDSGDGMQLAGTQFTDTSALVGNDVSTLPDFPAEIRAPAGTLAGVSGYQIQFSSTDIFTPGDEVDALVAMNPAALKMNVRSLKRTGVLIVNEDAFDANDLKKAGYPASPLDDNSLSSYRVVRVPMNTLVSAALKDSGLTAKQVDRCKNFFALGVVYWLYGRPLEPTLNYINAKFAKKMPEIALANAAALKAGYNYGETCELFHEQYHVERAKLPPGKYRTVTGNEAIVLGMAAAAQLSGKQLLYASYPITPASDILHGLADLKQFNVATVQAEDEISAIGVAMGAAFGGSLGVTGTSGPGLALKSEAIGLAVMTELPVVIVDVQRGGPSTGLPTKTEQADLLQAMFGRNGECPVPIIAAASPSDCFHAALESIRTATRYMTPVLLLTDGYVANSSEPWLIPDTTKIDPIKISHPQQPCATPTGDGPPAATQSPPSAFLPYERNADLARPWAIPGTCGLEHRIGGLEKQDLTGNVSYDPANHEHMVRLRAAKVAGIKPAGMPYLWTGPDKGDLLLIGWGGTCGALKAATLDASAQGLKVAHCHLRYLNPLPQALPALFKNFTHLVCAELNLGQLALLLRARYLLDIKPLTKVRGQPFTQGEILRALRATLDTGTPTLDPDATPPPDPSAESGG